MSESADMLTVTALDEAVYLAAAKVEPLGHRLLHSHHTFPPAGYGSLVCLARCIYSWMGFCSIDTDPYYIYGLLLRFGQFRPKTSGSLRS